VTALRALLAILLATTAALAIPMSASAVTGSSMVVSPSRGTSHSTFTATYRYSDLTANGLHLCDTNIPVAFTFNELQRGTAALTWNMSAHECVATFTGTPAPADGSFAPGTYAVSIGNDQATKAMFTIEPTPSPTATTHTKTPPTKTSTKPVAVPTRTTTAPTTVPAASGDPSPLSHTAPASPPPTSTPPTTPVAVLAGSAKPDSSSLLQILTGTLLFLAVAAGGFVAWRRYRRPRRATAPPD